MNTEATLAETGALRDRVIVLEALLQEKNDTLEAIRAGEIDAVMVSPNDDYHLHILQSVDQPFRVLIEQIQEGAVSLREDGTMLYGNRRLAELFGIPQNEIIGQKLQSFVSPRDVTTFERVLHEAKKAGTRCEITLCQASGELAVYISLSFLRRDHKASILCGVLTDLTEHKLHLRNLAQVNAELKSSNASLEAFAHLTSHDLKAPLRGIMHLVEWISEDLNATVSPETSGHLKLLQVRAMRLHELLDVLLTYSRIGRDQSELEELNIADLVHDIVAASAPRPGFVVTCADSTPTIRTRRTELRMVLDCLIANGLKHHDRTEGRVVVAMHLVDGVAEFRISDDGPGIPVRYHDHVFVIFQALASRDEFEASGTGLAIVKKMVEIRGGGISIESTPGERGTTFVFSWKEDVC